MEDESSSNSLIVICRMLRRLVKAHCWKSYAEDEKR
jgi:hypothetical protein